MAKVRFSIFVGWPHKDHPDEELEQLRISTVKDDGRVYFTMSSEIPAPKTKTERMPITSGIS